MQAVLTQPVGLHTSCTPNYTSHPSFPTLAGTAPHLSPADVLALVAGQAVHHAAGTLPLFTDVVDEGGGGLWPLLLVHAVHLFHDAEVQVAAVEAGLQAWEVPDGWGVKGGGTAGLAASVASKSNIAMSKMHIRKG